jgi:hypothetical protein
VGGINISINYCRVASYPGNGRVEYFYKVFVGYIEIEGASCPWNRRVIYFYKLYCRIYRSRRGFMPLE